MRGKNSNQPSNDDDDDDDDDDDGEKIGVYYSDEQLSIGLYVNSDEEEEIVKNVEVKRSRFEEPCRKVRINNNGEIIIMCQ